MGADRLPLLLFRANRKIVGSWSFEMRKLIREYSFAEELSGGSSVGLSHLDVKIKEKCHQEWRLGVEKKTEIARV